jgi:hypothetical protein
MWLVIYIGGRNPLIMGITPDLLHSTFGIDAITYYQLSPPPFLDMHMLFT